MLVSTLIYWFPAGIIAAIVLCGVLDALAPRPSPTSPTGPGRGRPTPITLTDAGCPSRGALPAR